MTTLDSLDSEHLDTGLRPQRGLTAPQVNNAPHVGPEPELGGAVGLQQQTYDDHVCVEEVMTHLVSPDQDGVRHGQQPHQSPVLEKPDDLRLVREALVNTHLLHLRHQHLDT